MLKKVLRGVNVRDKDSNVPAKPKRKTKGVRHHVHAVSLSNIADTIQRAAGDGPINQMTNGQLLSLIANIIKLEAERVQGIVR